MSRQHNQINLFHLGRHAALDGNGMEANPIDDEKEPEKYIWWHEGWEFGKSELEEELNG